MEIKKFVNKYRDKLIIKSEVQQTMVDKTVISKKVEQEAKKTSISTSSKSFGSFGDMIGDMVFHL